MQHVDWNQMSELGLVERINREILHPLGLGLSRDVETGHSSRIFVAPDGVWDYDVSMKTTVITDDEVRKKLSEMLAK